MAHTRASIASASGARARETDSPGPVTVSGVAYIGATVQERAEIERELGNGLRVAWTDATTTVADLHRIGLPILVDFARGAATLHLVRELRSVRPDALMFAVVDGERADLVVEAVLAGMADVFTRPLNGRQIALAVRRALGDAGHPGVGDELYSFSPAMREVRAQVVRAASLRA